jgi:small subunit ribosomal protein S21
VFDGSVTENWQNGHRFIDWLGWFAIARRVFLLKTLESLFYQRKVVKGLTSVHLRPNETQEQLFRRFRKSVAKSGILSTVRQKRWFVSKSEVRRINKKKAIRRLRRRQYIQRDR